MPRGGSSECRPRSPGRSGPLGAFVRTHRLLLFCVLPAVFLLLSFLVFILRNWHIKAYSDPMAWLLFAQSFRARLATTNLPLGFPAYLWLALKATGPYYVFLANLPVLALLLALVGVLTSHAARETETPPIGKSIGLLAVALLLGFDPDSLVYMTNPYRDPLSYVLLTGALALLARYVALPNERRWHLAVSGLLTGLAYCVREPSLLAVGPMFLLGVLHERKAGLASLLRSAGAFALGLAAGALPLLVQTFVIRRQVSISPYVASHDTLLPGFHSVALPETLSKAASYFFMHMGGLGIALLLAGAALAVYRRNRTLLGLLLLSALYALFYGFYWMFSKRYYYVVALTAIPLAAYGAYAALFCLGRLIRRPAWIEPAFRSLALLISLAAGLNLLATGGAHAPFRPPQARRFVDTMHSAVPSNATLLCERPLADVIRTLAGLASVSPSGLRAESPELMESIVASSLQENRPVFFMKTLAPDKADPDETLIRRHFDLLPAAEFPSADYRLENFTWGNPVSLYRIQPWSRTQTEHALAIECPSILRLDVGQLWDDDTRTRAELFLNGQRVIEQVQNGINYAALPPHTSRAAAIVLNSDRPVPSDLRPALLPLDEPIDLDFGAFSTQFHDAWLSPEFFQEPAHNQFARRLNGHGSIRLPLPWREPMTVFAEVMARPADMAAGGSMSIAIQNGEPVAVKLPAKAPYRGVLISFAHDGSQDFRRLEMSGSFDLDRIYLHPARAIPVRELDVGSPADTPFLTEGFYARERLPDGATVRWTAPSARVTLFLSKPAAGTELHVEYADSRPPAAPPANVTMTFNRQFLALRDEPHPAMAGRRILKASLPAGVVFTGENELVISCQGWNPGAVLNSPDTRELGLHVDSIRVRPSTPD